MTGLLLPTTNPNDLALPNDLAEGQAEKMVLCCVQIPCCDRLTKFESSFHHFANGEGMGGGLAGRFNDS